MEQKLDEHGLLALGWTAHLDRAVRRFGACLPEHKQITVSRKLAAMNSDEQVLDVPSGTHVANGIPVVVEPA